MLISIMIVNDTLLAERIMSGSSSFQLSRTVLVVPETSVFLPYEIPEPAMIL